MVLKKFYVQIQAQNNGRYKVHEESCPCLPQPEDRLYIGGFSTSEGALTAAARYYTQADACKYCAPAGYAHQQAAQQL